MNRLALRKVEKLNDQYQLVPPNFRFDSSFDHFKHPNSFYFRSLSQLDGQDLVTLNLLEKLIDTRAITLVLCGGAIDDVYGMQVVLMDP